MRHALFLRGINVGPVRVPMTDLRALLASLGLRDVRTWLATGNAAFEADDDAATLRPVIERALTERFGYDAHVQVLDHDALRGIVESMPFPAREDHHRYVVLCDGPEVLDRLVEEGEELGADVATGSGVVYWSCPIGRSTDEPFAKLLARKALRAATTTRNIQTLQKML